MALRLRRKYLGSPILLPPKQMRILAVQEYILTAFGKCLVTYVKARNERDIGQTHINSAWIIYDKG